jgi:alpha-glucosidase
MFHFIIMNIMKKDLVFILAACLLLAACGERRSYTCGDRVAVFLPGGFDPSGTLPSLAIVKELKPSGAVPPEWRTRPVFGEEGGRSVITIAVEKGTDLYGTGEVTGPLRRNGTRVATWNLDNYLYALEGGRNLYQSHPWFIGTRLDGTAFGVLVDGSWRCEFALGDTARVTCDGPAPRVVVIEREGPREVLVALGELTGRMELPPLWALGFQQSRWSYFPEARVREIAGEFRRREIPCDVIWMDIDYMDGFRVFTFDSTRFPDPAALNAHLHENGFKAVYMIDPGVKRDTTYGVYREGTAGNHWVTDSAGGEYNGDVWPGPCAFPDFTRPETRDWWRGLYRDFIATGVDGVWNDMNEPAVFRVESHTMPLSNVHRGGGGLPAGTHARYHNVYGLLMVQATREGILEANPGKRPFVLSRANFLGGHRYAATWSGDNASSWAHLRMSIPMTLNLGLSGQPFNGADIGGFGGNARRELLAHWMAVGVYYPFARNHSAKGTVNQEPWALGDTVEHVSRRAINRRYRLLPYLYTLFREASVTGLPVARPLFMADPRDTSLRREQQAFLLGDDLMITPRWARDVKYPGGEWRRFTLEEGDDGYQPLLALRPGAILPVGKVVQSTVTYSTDSITLFVNLDPTGTATGTLYDDAGDGFTYRDGDYSLHRFTATASGVTITRVEGNRDPRRHYRLALLAGDTVTYTAWSNNTTISLP